MLAQTTTPNNLADLLAELPGLRDHHAPSSTVYAQLKAVAREEVEQLFASTTGTSHAFGSFGQIVFPYLRMGAIDSLDLFGLDELILFSFYWSNRTRYQKVLDLGANIGLHSLVLSRCGYRVRSYEPDPTHFALLTANLARNGAGSVETINAAISAENGSMEFIRVLGNTTGSHLAGAKEHVYGDIERFEVEVRALAPEMAWADLIKMDVEGHEAAILCTTTADEWRSTDAVVEIGSPRNAALVFEHFLNIGVNLFAQKLNWRKVRTLEDMPSSYHDGSLFISQRDAMPWNQA